MSEKRFIHVEAMVPCEKAGCRLSGHHCLKCIAELASKKYGNIDSDEDLEVSVFDDPLTQEEADRIDQKFDSVLSGESDWHIIRRKLIFTYGIPGEQNEDHTEPDENLGRPSPA